MFKKNVFPDALFPDYKLLIKKIVFKKNWLQSVVNFMYNNLKISIVKKMFKVKNVICISIIFSGCCVSSVKL